MEAKNRQYIKDKILSCEGAIKQIDEKINLIRFIGSVNNSFVPTDLLNMDELQREKTLLKQDLRKLKYKNI